MNIPRSKNTGERGHKYMNIPRSKNTKGSINETLHGHLSTVKEDINRCVLHGQPQEYRQLFSKSH